MLLDTNRDKNIDLIDEKVSILYRTHIAVRHRNQGGSPGRHLLKYAIASKQRISNEIEGEGECERECASALSLSLSLT